MILGLCDRWHKTPDEIVALDADLTLRLLHVVRMASPDTTTDDVEVPVG